ncbi:MAG: hypothetical protein WC547_05465, partial [Candidatus Omnitrophota bacterium]
MNLVFSKIVSLLVVVSICFSQCGCSMVMPTKQRFSVTASEPDAKIYVNGEYIGAGNIQTRVPRNQAVSVMAKKDGFYPATREIGTEMSMVGILDIIGGCIFLLPFIGLAFPGS